MNKLISLQRYSISPEEFNLIQITHIIENDSCHIVSLFKEHLIYDEGTDFLRRFYGKRESSIRLTKLYEYYNASSMLFPNYTALPEGKYIYKNIMKKQKVIDLIEAMDEEKENQKKNKKDKEEDRVFDTKIYESIAFEPDMSKIKEIFNITIKDDSFEEIKKLTNYLVDIVDADQFPMETTPNSPSITYQHNSHNKNNNCINLTTTTATTLNNTNNQKKSVIDKQNQKSNFNCIKHNKIKLSLATEIKNTLAPTLKSKLNLQLNSFFKHRPVLTMPMIEIKSPISHRKLSSTKMNSSKEKKKSNLVINHNYMQSMPSELNSYLVGYNYAYELPKEQIKITEVLPREVEYRKIGNKIYSKDLIYSVIGIRTETITPDNPNIPDEFWILVAYAMAFLASESMSNNDQAMIQIVSSKYNMYLEQMKLMDATTGIRQVCQTE